MIEDTRNRLKDAALALFLEKGFGGTSIGAIEAMAGLAPRAGGFYRHFESKEALLAEIAREEIVERASDFGIDGLLPLPSIKAELVVIGRAYLRAARRQQEYAELINECRRLPALRDMAQGANEDMYKWLRKWIASKPFGSRLKGVALNAMTMTVFGGFLFYLTKRAEGVRFPSLDDEAMLDAWAGYWASELAGERAREREEA